MSLPNLSRSFRPKTNRSGGGAVEEEEEASVGREAFVARSDVVVRRGLTRRQSEGEEAVIAVEVAYVQASKAPI